MWIDGFNGIAQHLAQTVDFAIAAAADPAALRQHARNRGWRNLRLLSCGESTFKFDLGSEDADGEQDSTVSVFTRDATARSATTTAPTRAWTTPSKSAASTCYSPVWQLLDLTPQGRGDWYPGRFVQSAVNAGSRGATRAAAFFQTRTSPGPSRARKNAHSGRSWLFRSGGVGGYGGATFAGGGVNARATRSADHDVGFCRSGGAGPAQPSAAGCQAICRSCVG